MQRLILFSYAITFLYFFIQSAAGAIGASRNLRRFGQSIKRVVREVKDAENLEAAGIKLVKSIAFFCNYDITSHINQYIIGY